MSELTKDSPFLKRYLAWSNERFPMANVISGIITYIVMTRVALFLQDKALSFELIDILGAIAVVGHYFVLRVFDEHKDFEIDCINHPDRALQKGIISLKELDIITAIFTIIGVWFSLSVSNNYLSLVCYIALYIWSILMAKEFFCGEWLEKRLTLYSISHMLVSPFIITWVMSSKWEVASFDTYTIVVLVMSLASGFSYEFTRKCRGPEEETQTLDSYTKIYGIKGTVVIISIMNTITLVCFLYFLQVIPVNAVLTGILAGVGYLLTQLTLIKFISHPSLKARKKNEGAFGLYALLLYIALLIGLYTN